MKPGTSQVNGILMPAQCRAARALVEMSREDLAARAAVGVRTIADFESGKRQPIPSTRLVLRLTLEAAGVVFVDPNGEGPGARLKK